MSRIDEIEAELTELRKRQTKLTKDWKRLKDRSFSRQMGRLFPDGEITLERVFQVDWIDLGHGYSQKWWDKITRWLDIQQHGTWNPETCQQEGPMPLRGAYREGYNPDTNQVAFKLMLRKGEPLDEQMGIKLLLPHMKAHEGWKRFRIFRHDLSARGCWSLRVSKDGKTAEVWDDRHLWYAAEFGDKQYKAEFTGTIEEALAYAQDRHYYEWEGHEEEDDDDLY